jgi:two-component system, NtrC family, nitrogen regulation sensor histidine kinase NtrY
VTLALRLLLAIGVLTIVSTATLALGVREAWRQTEEERFRTQFAATAQRLRDELRVQNRALPRLVTPLCAYDVAVDGALVDLAAGNLDPGRRLALSLRVPSLMRAVALDELVLVTDAGEILGAGHAEGLVGKTEPELGALIRTDQGDQASVRLDRGPRALVAHCRAERGRIGLGLVAARHLDPLLEQVGGGGVTLTLEAPPRDPSVVVESLTLPELEGLTVYATQSRKPLYRALQRLDTTVLALGSATFAAALLLAWLLSRGLARPIVKLSRQARRVVHGEPVPVQGRGGRELRELADSFNQALADLVALRKRLATTERIAARREIARRVAHEIKNPLAPIRAAIETLRRLRLREDPRFDEYFDEASQTVLSEVERITTIVNEFTRFARLPPPTPAPHDLVAAVKQVVGLHDSEPVRVELIAHATPTVTADRDQMIQVITNLVQNAVDACGQGPAPRVTVEVALLDPDHVRISVEDNGPGIAPEMRDRLFEPYATTKEKGTGLGLAIVHRIVVEHGGEIVHRAPAGGGARFEITLPVAGPALLPEPAAPISSSA